MRILLMLLCLFSTTIYASEIDAINSSNLKITTLSANVHTTTFKDRAQVSADGILLYDRELNSIRFVTRKPLGVITDMGVNSTHFWLWSKRLDRTFYYGSIKFLDTDQLPNSISPRFVLDTLCLDVLQNGKYLVIQDKPLYVIPYRNSVRAVYLNKDKTAIIGNYLYDNNKVATVISSVEKHYKTQFGGYIPVRSRITIPKEKITIICDMSNIKINFPIDKQNWIMPNYNNRKEITQ